MRSNNPEEQVRQLQRKLFMAAKQNRGRRFHALYDRIHRGDVLMEAWKRVRARRGAAGVDGETLREVEQRGVEEFLTETPRPVAAAEVSTATGPAAIHPEARRQEAAAGHSCGPGSGSADGGEAGVGADL